MSVLIPSLALASNTLGALGGMDLFIILFIALLLFGAGRLPPNNRPPKAPSGDIPPPKPLRREKTKPEEEKWGL